MMDLLIAQPELCGVVWREITKALLVLDPVFVEVHAAVTSLFAKQTTVGDCSEFNNFNRLVLSVQQKHQC